METSTATAINSDIKVMARYMRKKGTKNIFYAYNDNPLVLEQCEIVPYGYTPANPEHVALLWKYGRIVGNEIIITPEIVHPDENQIVTQALPDQTTGETPLDMRTMTVIPEEKTVESTPTVEHIVLVDDPLWEFSRKELMSACDKLRITYGSQFTKPSLITLINKYYDFDREKLDSEINRIRDTIPGDKTRK